MQAQVPAKETPSAAEIVDWLSLEPETRLFNEVLRPAGVSARMLSYWKNFGLVKESVLLAAALKDASSKVHEGRIALAAAIDALFGFIGDAPPILDQGGFHHRDQFGLPLSGSRVIELRQGVARETGRELHLPVGASSQRAEFFEVNGRLLDEFAVAACRVGSELIPMPDWFPSIQGPGQYRVFYLVVDDGVISQHLASWLSFDVDFLAI